jgi:hypothetical protein
VERLFRVCIKRVPRRCTALPWLLRDLPVFILICLFICLCICSFIYSSACDGRAAAFSCVFVFESSVVAAGGTWTSRTTGAPWGGRCWHTSVIDAVSGAIYVIGGSKGHSAYNDVWATDGGARPDSRRGFSGVLQGVLQGYYRGSRGMLTLHSGVLLWVVWEYWPGQSRGTCRVLRGTQG